MRVRTITVNDKMQKGYRYQLSAPEGRDFASEFRPDLSPKEMLALGVFGGKYLTDCTKEFPPDWFKNAKLAPAGRNKRCNYFGVLAGQSLTIWRQKGWIHPDDPRGWFQWYCRYYRGRRHVDDERQIKRWWAFRRHARQLAENCDRGDFTCRPRQRQALLQWAYDSRRY